VVVDRLEDEVALAPWVKEMGWLGVIANSIADGQYEPEAQASGLFMFDNHSPALRACIAIAIPTDRNRLGPFPPLRSIRTGL
jgi:hypothetical protein